MQKLHSRVDQLAQVNQAEYLYTIKQQPHVADLLRSHFSLK